MTLDEYSKEDVRDENDQPLSSQIFHYVESAQAFADHQRSLNLKVWSNTTTKT